MQPFNYLPLYFLDRFGGALPLVGFDVNAKQVVNGLLLFRPGNTFNALQFERSDLRL